MKLFEKKFRFILNVLSFINKTMVIDNPIMMVRSDNGSLAAFYRMEEEIGNFEKIGIYNISEFLSIFKLFENEPSVDFSNNILMFKEKDVTIQYVCTDLNILTAYDTNIDILTSTENMDDAGVLKLTDNEYGRISKIIDIFREVEYIRFKGEKDKDVISVQVISSPSTNTSNKYSNDIKTPGVKNTCDFDIVISTLDFKSIYKTDYNIRIKKDDDDNYRLLLSPQLEQLNGVKYISAALLYNNL